MDISLWRYTITIEGETVRSPKSFVTQKEGINHIIESAHSLARTYQGGANTSVSDVISHHDEENTFYVLLFNGTTEVARFELTKLTGDDSMIQFKLEHPYLHQTIGVTA